LSILFTFFGGNRHTIARYTATHDESCCDFCKFRNGCSSAYFRRMASECGKDPDPHPLRSPAGSVERYRPQIDRHGRRLRRGFRSPELGATKDPDKNAVVEILTEGPNCSAPESTSQPRGVRGNVSSPTRPSRTRHHSLMVIGSVEISTAPAIANGALPVFVRCTSHSRSVERWVVISRLNHCRESTSPSFLVNQYLGSFS
jgi:hypothetical protein